MAKLDRIVAKIFGETADPTGVDPQIGQFGSASLGTYVGTGDVATIQGLPAWSNGWIDAVTPTQQFPTLPEMTGVHKVLSYHEAYLLQSGIPEWNEDTTYYTNDFCRVGHIVYYSLQDENINHNPTTDTLYWKDFTVGANQELSNLEDAGEDRLHALKGYLENGQTYTDETLYNNVYIYNHSTNITGIDTVIRADYTEVGSPTISADGIASGFSASNYLTKDLNLSGSSLKIKVPFNVTNVTKTQQIISNSNFQLRLLYVSASTALYPSLYITDGVNTAQPRTSTYGLQANTDYVVEIEYKHNVSVDIKLYSASGVLLDSLHSTSSGTTSAVIPNSTLTTKIGSSSGSDYLEGSIDLCGLRIEADFGVYRPILKIPYNLSSTGSKIVDVAYRDRVIDVFEQFGSANYYTIDETNQNATLPMGEVYGFIEGKASTDFDNVTQTAIDKALDWIMPDWSRAVNKNPYETYTATQRGWVNAQGYTNQDEIGVKINSNVVAYTQAPGGTGDDSGFACLVPVNVGDQYETYVVNGYTTNERIDFVKFIPCKGEA